MRKDVEKIYCAMDIFAFPSKYEGVGVALIEAQASGLNCVASNCIPEECKVLDSLCFLPITDSEKWARKIVDEPVVDNRSSFCNDIVNAGFDIKESTLKMQEIYCGLLE